MTSDYKLQAQDKIRNGSQRRELFDRLQLIESRMQSPGSSKSQLELRRREIIDAIRDFDTIAVHKLSQASSEAQIDSLVAELAPVVEIKTPPEPQRVWFRQNYWTPSAVEQWLLEYNFVFENPMPLSSENGWWVAKLEPTSTVSSLVPLDVNIYLGYA